jgi:DNA uptake protein ComE-like DNA-binding protein
VLEAVDLNTATTEELEALPGIDARRAALIVKARPYSKPDEVMALRIITPSEFNKIKSSIIVSVGGSKPAIPLAAKAPAGLVDLNTATKSELDALPGDSASDAVKIVAARPYASIDDLIRKGVISNAVFNKIKGAITVSNAQKQAVVEEKPATSPLAESAPVDLNTASAEDLATLPGIDPKRAAAIIAARPYARISELVSKDIMPKSAYDVIKGNITASPAKPQPAGKHAAEPSSVAMSPPAEDSSATAGASGVQGSVAVKPALPEQKLVDLNTATLDELITLPRIGTTRAKTIIAGRPYATAEEVVTKGYVPQSTFDLNKDRIVVAGANR